MLVLPQCEWEMSPATHHPEPDDVLRGEKVSIRPPRIEEISFIRTLWADPRHFPEAEAEAWFGRMVDPGDSTNCYRLIFNHKDIPVGEISFHRWNRRERSAELNIKILAAFRGNGYGKDALQTFLGWFFGRAGGRRMTDDVAADNRTGQRLLRTLGFEQDNDVSDVCRLFMTRRMFEKKYGESGLKERGNPAESE